MLWKHTSWPQTDQPNFNTTRHSPAIQYIWLTLYNVYPNSLDQPIKSAIIVSCYSIRRFTLCNFPVNLTTVFLSVFCCVILLLLTSFCAYFCVAADFCFCRDSNVFTFCEQLLRLSTGSQVSHSAEKPFHRTKYSVDDVDSIKRFFRIRST